jgi:hypothetical protein
MQNSPKEQYKRRGMKERKRKLTRNQRNRKSKGNVKG